MKKLNYRLLVFILFGIMSCNTKQTNSLLLASPNESITIKFDLNQHGKAYYEVSFNGQTVIDTSFLGFDFKDAESFNDNFKIVNSSQTAFNETWQMPWGEQLDVVNNYNKLKIELEETTVPNRKLNIVFKAYDDGIGFRYEFPKQDHFQEALISEENTQFNLTEDYKTFWIPGDWDIYEHLYHTTKISEIDATKLRNHPNLAQTYIPNNAVNTPVTMVGENGIHLSLHEAALTDYSGMTLEVDNENLKLQSVLVGSENTDYKVKRSIPFNTPWRTIQIADKAGDLIESKMILNLNEPNQIGDVSYFTPMKYVGIWWEMHLGKSTWDFEGSQDMSTFTTGKKGSSRHGATTENAKRFIDFASANNIKGLLVEGWNTGWDKWISKESREGVFDFMTPYPDYNFDEVMSYSKEKGVEVIMHHETSAAPLTYEKQMDVAYNFMKENGINSVKTGYVGKITPEGEYHHGQWMVNHYHKVLEEAAKKKIAINAHEPIKATGKRRTYPNAISREGLRGQEFNAWASDGGNPPEHLSIVAFTRMLAGPIDYTPGIFNIKFNEYKENNQVNTTLAQQLALYVVIYSPIQMVADLVEHYEANPEPLQFIKDVGVDWSETKVLNGEVGDYVTIARKDRETGNWFVGSITDENERDLEINFDFLEEGLNYTATVYKDADDAHWDNNPTGLDIETVTINKNSKLTIKLAPGGGAAISLMK